MTKEDIWNTIVNIGNFMLEEGGIFCCVIGMFTMPLFNSMDDGRHEWIVVWHVDQVAEMGEENLFGSCVVGTAHVSVNLLVEGAWLVFYM
jgi:hypothetical protein